MLLHGDQAPGDAHFVENIPCDHANNGIVSRVEYDPAILKKYLNFFEKFQSTECVENIEFFKFLCSYTLVFIESAIFGSENTEKQEKIFQTKLPYFLSLVCLSLSTSPPL